MKNLSNLSCLKTLQHLSPLLNIFHYNFFSKFNISLHHFSFFLGEVESEGGVRADMHASRPAGHARLRTVRPGNIVR